MGMALDGLILEEVGAGRIVIDPFNQEQLNSNSYDLRLGDSIKTYVKPKSHSFELGITKFLSRENPWPTEWSKYEIDEPIFLQPGELYLAHTLEYTETHYPWIPVINGKSSLGRLGLSVHITAGFGDCGFCGQWTLEMTAVKPLQLKVGQRICQISYHRGEGKLLQPYNGHYQNQVGAVPAKPE